MTPALRAWYHGRRVFVTGHTGFKGAWLTAWLKEAGAIVTGYALPPTGEPNLFSVAGVGAHVTSVLADVMEPRALGDALRASAPEIIFHLAAQSLVRRSYEDPVATYATNVMGTVHLLDAARHLPSLRAVVVVTSDKCYENQGIERGYREDDPMGGHDPYSASKGCAELVTASMRRAFFRAHPVAIASARAGNVIGGGDWAPDRLVPDIVRGAARREPCLVRNPDAVRPWQFVLEPLRGYLLLGQALVEHGHDYAEAWNFGPSEGDAVPVRDLVERMHTRWDRVSVRFASERSGPHEAQILRLDSAKAHARLRWQPVFNLDDSLDKTMDWYRMFYEAPGSAPRLMHSQLGDYADRVTADEVTS
ncbi:MAG: CDP-glucose 4,6-dehydratase [Betaproteobacteria bacterium]